MDRTSERNADSSQSPWRTLRPILLYFRHFELIAFESDNTRIVVCVLQRNVTVVHEEIEQIDMDQPELWLALGNVVEKEPDVLTNPKLI